MLQELSNFREGESGVVNSFDDDTMAAKFLTMGVIPGKSLQLMRRIPFGGGLYIKVGDSNIAVRELEARHIFLETE